MEISVPEYSREDRGQVGIETLIVFIAMILVAAIAASVLIHTAGYLQNQASTTSQESEDQVSNQVLIISSIGDIDAGEDYSITVEYDDGEDHLVVNDPWFDELTVEYYEDGDGSGEPDETLIWEADGADDTFDVESLGITEADDTLVVGSPELDYDDSSLDADPAVLSDLEGGDSDDAQVRVAGEHNSIGGVRMTVMQSPGADEIDLEGASVEYIGPNGQETLTYADVASAEDTTFAVEAVRDDDGTSPVLTQRQDRLAIIIDLDYEYELGTDSDLRNLEEGEDATVRIVTQSGSEAVTILNAPQSLSSYDDGNAVEV